VSAKAIVLASGRGSNFEAIYNAISEKKLDLNIEAVLSNKADAGILASAKEKNIPYHFLDLAKKDEQAKLALYQDIFSKYHFEWIILAGYLQKIPSEITKKFKNKIVNIHPSLLPLHGGKNMYGHNVHEAVWQSGAKISGATVHFVNDHYDEGAIILQDSVLLDGSENPLMIAEKVLKIEHQIFTKALNILVKNKYKIVNNKVILES
jgi:phosphoribosylglycinamide formyltransferase-1